jgi:hypothetical protein
MATILSFSDSITELFHDLLHYSGDFQRVITSSKGQEFFYAQKNIVTCSTKPIIFRIGVRSGAEGGIYYSKQFWNKI